jgi:aquaporin Z
VTTTAQGTQTTKDAKVDAAARQVLLHFEETTLRQHPLWIRLIVEGVGTFFLVCVAAGSGVINQYVVVHMGVSHGPITRTAAVVAPGAIVMAMIYALGPLSGLHINPAVTLAFTARGVFKRAWALPYVAVQLLGACAAAAFLQAMFVSAKYGGNYPIATKGGDWRSFVMETLLTLILVTVILHTATGSRSIGHNAALAVGATVALLGLFASPISGASMNPARTLGPDLVSGDFTGWWVYIAGPLLGAILAVALIRLVRGLPSTNETQAAYGDALPE